MGFLKKFKKIVLTSVQSAQANDMLVAQNAKMQHFILDNSLF